MDVNSDGRVTRQEFVRSCINDSNLAQLLSPKYFLDEFKMKLGPQIFFKAVTVLNVIAYTTSTFSRLVLQSHCTM